VIAPDGPADFESEFLVVAILWVEGTGKTRSHNDS
jgi:hypothetical protein